MNNKGYTLIELMIAVVLILFGFIAFATVQWTALTGSKTAQNETAATSLGQGLVEQLVFSNYTSDCLDAGSHPTSTDISRKFVPGNPIFSNNTSAVSSAMVGTKFTRTWSVMDNYSGTGLKSVMVTVSWGEKAGIKNRTFRFLKSQFY